MSHATATDRVDGAPRADDAPQRARLLFAISGLTGGGAERVLSVIANGCADRGHAVTLLTIEREAPDFYAVRPTIRRVRLGIDPASSGLFQRARIEVRLLRALRAQFRSVSPDAVISFSTETNVRVLVAAIGLRSRILVSERSDPASMPLGRVWGVLRSALYGLARAVVVQTPEARDWIVSHTTARRTLLIPNPVASPAWTADEVLPLPTPAVVAMGRLRPEKGFDMLLDAFALTRAEHPDWHLAIIGDGPQRGALERRAEELALEGAVTFVGLLSHPMATLRQGQLFVLPSRFEGFPNVLLEAMACGLPVVSFDCPSGPRAIITPDVDGVLVPPTQIVALAAAMSRLMADPGFRARLGAAARAVTERFAVDRIVTMWLSALGPSGVTPGLREEVAAGGTSWRS